MRLISVAISIGDSEVSFTGCATLVFAGVEW